MKSRILFVGELNDLKTSLERMQCQWDMVFKQNGQEAVETLASDEFDVVVTDTDIPDSDGSVLLNEISEQHPKIIRMMLLGENGHLVQSVAPAHQCLQKPCDPEVLEAKVGRAFALRRILMDETLTACVSKMKSLPSPPTLYFDIMKELASGGGKTMTKVGQLVAQDIAMTAKILQLVNSVHYGLSIQTSNPVHATKLLGPTAVRALVLSTEVFSQCGKTKLPGISFDRLLAHSQVVGSFAKKILELEGAEKTLTEDAFLAGVLHDTGKLVLADNFPDGYTETAKLAESKGLEQWQAEQERFGATHAEMGAYLMGLWGMADPIVETLAFHHRPSACLDSRFGLLTAVHAANAIELELHQREAGREEPFRIDEAYLSEMNMIDRLPVWKEACRKALSEPDW